MHGFPQRQPSLACVVLLLAGTLACSSAQPSSQRPRLAPSDPLPTTIPRETKLAIGDPTVQKQLELTGAIAELPFTAEWHNISGGPNTLEAFRGAALDGGSVGDTPPVHAGFTGLDVKIVAVQVRTKPAYRLAIAPGSQIAKLEDLKGKRIGYSPGQAQGALILRVLKKLGLKPTDVTLVQLNSTEFKDALASRQVDVAPLFGAQLRRYLNEQAKAGAAAFEHGARDNLNFFYVRAAVLEDANQAAALRAYVKVRTQAQLWSFHHRERWIAEYYVKDQSLSPADARAVVEDSGEPLYPDDWSEAIALTQETIDLLAEASGKPRYDAAKLFDRRFEPLAAEAAATYASTAAATRTP
jgi:sulfonate transport system substrate-binding protein